MNDNLRRPVQSAALRSPEPLERALPHDVEALEDSAFLLTIPWPEDTIGV